jgi:hypothetical protein
MECTVFKRGVFLVFCDASGHEVARFVPDSSVSVGDTVSVQVSGGVGVCGGVNLILEGMVQRDPSDKAEIDA